MLNRVPLLQSPCIIQQFNSLRVAGRFGLGLCEDLRKPRADDTGDLDGLPETTVQIKDWRNILAAINSAMNDLPTQQANAGTTHGVAFIRRPGGRWIAVMSPEQFATLHREAVG